MRSTSQKHGSGNILIVDDTPANLRLLANILGDQGYEIRPATNGKHALLAARAEPPDLILLDIKMPGMSGYDVCVELKKDPRTENIPVIFISALDDIADKIKGFSLGGVDYITKPFQTEEVLARVKTHLTLQHLYQHLQQQNMQLQQEIYERQRIQEELTSYKHHLEELVEQRTSELQERNRLLEQKNIELLQAKKAIQHANDLAEAANRTKNEFIANISHELRTPLNHILGFTRLLQEDPSLGEEQKDQVTTILRSGEHLLLIINDLIDLSKIEAGKMPLQLSPFHFPMFLHTLVEMFHIRARQKELTFEVDISEQLPEFITADEKRLRQILLNLLGNAFKFTSKGVVTFRVDLLGGSEASAPFDALRESSESLSNRRTRSSNQFKSSIRFEIEDTGVGIPRDQLDKIFLAFHQIGNKWLAQSQGPGLGLTISQRLCHTLGSELHVRSTIGKGSLFWFDLTLPSTLQSEVSLEDPLDDFSEEAGNSFSQEREEAFEIPPQDTVAAIYYLAGVGDVIELRRYIDRLDESLPEYGIFTKKIRHFAKSLQLTSIQEFLQRYLSQDTQKTL